MANDNRMSVAQVDAIYWNQRVQLAAEAVQLTPEANDTTAVATPLHVAAVSGEHGDTSSHQPHNRRPLRPRLRPSIKPLRRTTFPAQARDTRSVSA